MPLFGRRTESQAQSGYSVIDQQLAVSGEINTAGSVRVDGRVEGTRHRADTLIIGEGATVVGDIEARDVIIGGSIRGNVMASGRVEIQTKASVVGNIRASAMLLAEGGVVRGHLTVAPAGTETTPIAEPTTRRLELTPSHSARAISRG
jgi:cytoskeletal protein CcmA (bactofilin family)